MAYSMLRITDGTNWVDLIDRERGFLLNKWDPAISPFKGGGVWQSSPLSDGRRMVMRKFDNAVETFDVKCSSKNMDGVINYMQKLVSMLEKALAYWTTDWQKEPVWLEVRGGGESNIRYALLKNYSIPGLSNPFAQPFYSFCKSLNEFTLIMERDHWLDHVPGSSSCVEVNNLQDFDNDADLTEFSVEVTDNIDDIYVYLNGLVGYNNNVRNYYGVIPPDSYNCETGLRFQNVTVPQGATIWRAYLKVCAAPAGLDDQYDMDMVIMGENVDNAGVWETSSITGVDTSALYTNYMQRKQLRHTDAVATITSPADTWHTDKETQYIYGLEAVVQEIVDRAGWASGNSMAFFMEYRQPSDVPHNAVNARSFYSHDQGVAGGEFPPTLYIEYITGDATTAGREATCTGNPFVANKHVKAQITHIFRYEDTDADETPDTFTANLIGSGPPYDLMQNPISENDELYLGISEDVFDCAPFDSAVFDLSAAAVDVTLTWYYSTVVGPPPTWVALGIYGNGQLDIPGETIVYWAQPSNWVKCAVNGVTGYWVKVKFTNVVVTSVPPTQQNRDIYTSIMPFLDIDSLEVPGELPALARINIFGTSQIQYNVPDTVIMGLRSKSRGEEFSPYLNFSDTNNPRDIEMFYLNSFASLDVDSDAPAGKSVSVATSSISDWTQVGGFVISSDMAIQYRGRYHAYLRCSQTGGAAGNVRVKLGYRSARNDMAQTESRPTVTTSLHLIDMGVIEFGTDYTLTPNDYVESSVIAVYQKELSASSITMRYFDLILIPADEYFGMYTMIGWDYQELLIAGNYLDIDAIGNPRTPRSIIRRHTDDYATGNIVLAEWEHQSRGGPILQANADQRLWFLMAYGDYLYGIFQIKTYGKVYRCSRYLSMRGAE